MKKSRTITGRISFSKIPLHNIPIRTSLGKRVRDLMSDTSRGTPLKTADYSSLEHYVLNVTDDIPFKWYSDE